MEDVIEFFREFEGEGIDFAQGGEEGELGDFKENAFTAILAEDLSAAGILESPVVCYLEAGPHIFHREEAMELWMAGLKDPEGNLVMLMEERAID